MRELARRRRVPAVFAAVALTGVLAACSGSSSHTAGVTPSARLQKLLACPDGLADD